MIVPAQMSLLGAERGRLRSASVDTFKFTKETSLVTWRQQQGAYNGGGRCCESSFLCPNGLVDTFFLFLIVTLVDDCGFDSPHFD
jgi:hypothetical protein